LFRRVEHMLRDKPFWLKSRVTLVALLILYNWALAAFAWYLLFADDPPDDDEASASELHPDATGPELVQ
jgi:hypothetical protein